MGSEEEISSAPDPALDDVMSAAGSGARTRPSVTFNPLTLSDEGYLNASRIVRGNVLTV